jgi:hypothetical protein
MLICLLGISIFKMFFWGRSGPDEYHKIVVLAQHYLLFTILHPFGTRESIRGKVDHERQIILWYWQHVTNLAKVTMFIVYMSSARVLVWVRGRAEQKRSLTFCVFG